MLYVPVSISLPFRRLIRFLPALIIFSLNAVAHPMPSSVLLLDLRADAVAGEVQIPLPQLALAFQYDVMQHPETVADRFGTELRAYLGQHLRVAGMDGRNWSVTVQALSVQKTEQPLTGPYYELIARVLLHPAAGGSTRQFRVYYDAVLHQVVTHKVLVSIRQDWETGRLHEPPTQIGMIELDVVHNVIPPLVVTQENGSAWQGFRRMVGLGLEHIASGTDHLLFLLVLLLPAPLLVTGRRWGSFGGVRYGLTQLGWIISAFTLGHSATLLVGSMGWLRLPSQPVEVLIALSILISAVHAWRPIFAGREFWVAAGFGLVHGLAFADTLANLDLDTGRMLLSILGFNLGIELMQLMLVGITVPWLLLLSQTHWYTGLRVAGAVLASIASLAWITERLSNQPNPFTVGVEQAVPYAPYFLVAMVVFAVWATWLSPRPRRV